MTEKRPIWLTVYYDMPVNWMLLSFMTLTAREQIDYFEGPLLHLFDKNIERPTKNYLLALSMALYDYLKFYDDFYDDEDVIKENDRFLDLLLKARSHDIDKPFESYEAFMFGMRWESLRESARCLLTLTDLGFFSPPKPIEFDYLVELVDF